MSFFNWKDKSGTKYTAPGGKPAQDGTKVKVKGDSATMRGGYVVPDKKKS